MQFSWNALQSENMQLYWPNFKNQKSKKLSYIFLAFFLAYISYFWRFLELTFEIRLRKYKKFPQYFCIFLGCKYLQSKKIRKSAKKKKVYLVGYNPTRNFPGSQPKKIRSTVEKFRLYFELVSNVHWTYRWYTWHQAEEQSFNIQLFPQLFFREIFFQKIFSFLNQYNSLKNVIYIHWIQILIKS